jgi:hypothetical protein
MSQILRWRHHRLITTITTPPRAVAESNGLRVRRRVLTYDGCLTRFKFLAHSGFPSQRFSAADVIFEEGSKGDKIYVIRIYVIRTGEVVTERNAMSSRW